MTTGRLVRLAFCATVLILGVETAPRIPTQPLEESENELQVDLRNDEILSNGFITDMKKPSCGFVDEVEPNTGSRTKRWAPLGDGWKKRNLTYSIVKYPSKQPDRDGVDREIARAFALWAKYVDLNITRVSGDEADIVITFVSGKHGDCSSPFGGAGDPLAHAFSPGSGMGGDIHFNDKDSWSMVKLYDIALHEIGHSLGLGHHESIDSVMYYGWARHAGVELKAMDIAGIQALYGPKTNSSTKKKRSVSCTDSSIDTVFDTPDGNIYAFKGEHYWKVTKDGRADGSPELISSKWKELPGDIDTAFTYNRKTFFFKGSTYWTYVGDRMVRYQTEIGKRFPGIPNDIDAATVWTGDGDIYFFKGSKYWRYQLRRRTHVSSAYPRPITDWRGLPSRLDAAVSFDGSTYFFEGQQIYEFDDERFSVDPKGAQKMSPDFFGGQSR